MASISGSVAASQRKRAAERAEKRDEAERAISVEAELIALRRKAASWGANEDEDSISGFSGRWEALNNWFPAKVVYRGREYASVEHGFQAEKALLADDVEAAEAIRKAAHPKDAHALGRNVAYLGDKWERLRIPLMQALLRDKFRRDPALHERLMRTDKRNLIAVNSWGETHWGVSGGKGVNQLGKLLMLLRDEAKVGADTEAWLRDSFEIEAEKAVTLDPLSIEVSKGGEVVETLQLGATPLVHIGKHSTAHVQLEHPSISRRHAAVLVDKTRGLLLVDLASKAGVTLNGRRVPPSIGIPLKPGLPIVFGGSSRTHTLRINQRDALEVLQEQAAALRSQIAGLEKDVNDPKNLFGLLPADKRIDPTKTTCWLGNLSYKVTEDDLREFLRDNGVGEPVSVRIPTDPSSGEPKGFAFAEFSTAEIAHSVLRLAGETLMERDIKVDVTQTRQASHVSAGGAAGGGKGGARSVPKPDDRGSFNAPPSHRGRSRSRSPRGGKSGAGKRRSRSRERKEHKERRRPMERSSRSRERSRDRRERKPAAARSRSRSRSPRRAKRREERRRKRSRSTSSSPKDKGKLGGGGGRKASRRVERRSASASSKASGSSRGATSGKAKLAGGTAGDRDRSPSELSVSSALASE